MIVYVLFVQREKFVLFSKKIKKLKKPKNTQPPPPLRKKHF
jgi:hypothetical protein